MKSLISKLLSHIKRSIYDRAEKVSSTRIQAYITFGAILVVLAVYMAVFVGNAVQSLFFLKQPYVPSSEEIIIFGMILGHHLALLGIKNSGDKTLPVVLDKKKAEAPDTEVELEKGEDQNRKPIPPPGLE